MTAHLLRQDQHGQRWCIDHCASPDCWRRPDAGCCRRCVLTTTALEDDLHHLHCMEESSWLTSRT